MKKDKFKMWKLALSTIHIDGKVTVEEKKWFNEKIQTLSKNKLLGFSADQIAELVEVIDTPPGNFISEFENINDPFEASFVLHILKIVSHVDGDLDESEDMLYENLAAAAMKKVKKENIVKINNVTVREDDSVFGGIIDFVNDFKAKF